MTEDTNNSIYDLMYCEVQENATRFQEEILAFYPDVQISNGSDYIHQHRLVVEVDDLEENYLMNLMRMGAFKLSFMFQIWKTEEDKAELLHQLIKLILEEQGTE